MLTPPPPKKKKVKPPDDWESELETDDEAPVPTPPDPSSFRKKKVTVLEYDMRDFFKSCVQVYADLTGTNPEHYPRVPTPFGAEIGVEDGLSGPKGSVDVAPAMEALKECLESCDADAVPAHPDVPSSQNAGVLQPIAAKVLMKILYGARMARPDLLRAVCQPPVA